MEKCLRGADQAFERIMESITPTFKRGEFAAVLIVGWPGLGLLNAVLHCVKQLEREIGARRKANSRAAPAIVSLNALVHKNARSTFVAIEQALQASILARSDVVEGDDEFSVDVRNEDWENLLVIMKRRWSEKAATLVILENFHIFAEAQPELLYRLYDIHHHGQVGLAVVGTSTNWQSPFVIEKRARSRAALTVIHCAQYSVQESMQIMKQELQCDFEKEECSASDVDEIQACPWFDAVEKLFKSRKFEAFISEMFRYRNSSLSSCFTMLRHALLCCQRRCERGQFRLRMEDFNSDETFAYQDSFIENSIFPFLKTFSEFETLLLVLLFNETKHRRTDGCFASEIYSEYRKLVGGNDLYFQKYNYSDDVFNLALDRLAQSGVIVSKKVKKSSTTYATVSSKFYSLVLLQEEFAQFLQEHKDCLPTAIAQLGTGWIE